MDFNKIKTDYPRTYKIWKGSEYYDLKNERRLYDFFDENGIYVIIDDIWEWYIKVDEYGDGRYLYEAMGVCDSRTECEEEAFEKAFEILNDKLS